MSNKRQNNRDFPITFWHMCRDVLIASMNKGQFPLAVAAIVLVIMVVKMPSEDVSKLVFQIVEDIKEKYLIGDIIAGAALIGWFVHTKWQRRLIVNEMDRIAKERTDAQQRGHAEKLPSSRRH